jgi:hypothetical protein
MFFDGKLAIPPAVLQFGGPSLNHATFVRLPDLHTHPAMLDDSRVRMMLTFRPAGILKLPSHLL